jgi:hypothetical protein
MQSTTYPVRDAAPPVEEDRPADPPGADLPPRPRRRLLRPLTVLLMALLTGSGGVVAGVLVEKQQVPSGTASAPTGRVGGGGFGAGGGAGGAAGAAGAGAGAGSTIGQVSSISGKTLYVTDASGNTIKVTTSSASQITKTASTTLHNVRPGDSVVVQGATASDGTVTATAIRDSGTASGSSTSRGATGTTAITANAGSSSGTTTTGS